MYQTVLFDLDGTLTDPGVGITNSVMYALRRFGIEVENREELYPFIGPPLKDSFQRFYHFTEEQARLGIRYYREYFSDRGIFENVLYDGIGELLAKLHQAGRKVMLATSKPEPFAVRILEHFRIAAYFDFVAGAAMDETRTEKLEVMTYALGACRITNPAQAVMVGDREYDILGARKLGLDSVGVLYGYGSRQELEDAGATYLAERVEDLLAVL